MGAIHPSIDPALVRRLTELLPLRVFVQTGAPARAAALPAALPQFERVHAIRLSPDPSEQGAKEPDRAGPVTVHTGRSPEVLRRIRPELSKREVLYWLDAHGGPDAGDALAPECPVLAELEAIGSLTEDSVVMIDDARLFLSPPPPPHDPAEWPDLDQLLDELSKLSEGHRLMVVDDAIVLFPARIHDELREHARRHSIDWLGRLPRAREALAEPDDLTERVASLERLYARRLLGLPGRLQELKSRANRLATLRHHPPRPVRVPVRYRANGRLPDPPTISIVTPSFNHARFLPATIQSVLDQTYPSLEYVVQDGGSNDGTREILERYAGQLHHWDSAPDSGQTQALNLGFAHTSGEIMAYLNSDDMLLPGTLSHVAEFFRRHPEIDVVYGHRVLVDEDGMEIGRWVLPPHDDEVLSWADFVPQETLFWRRAAWEAAGNEFDESFRFAMDWDALVRLRDAGARMTRLPRFLGAFRVHDDQKTTAQGPTLGLHEMNRIRRRLHGRHVSQEEVLRHIRPYLVRHVMLDQLYRRGLLRY